METALSSARSLADSLKGFTVVTSDVRKLAERNQVASQEIGNLVSSSVVTVEDRGTSMDEIVPSIGKHLNC